jgi:RNA polymerase sigma-70 factor, ECF subfamily
VARVDTRAARRADPTRRFDELFRRLYPRLYDLCHRLLVDRWEAEDVVQDAFVKLVDAPVIDRPDAEVEAWLRRVCVNLGYNRLRGRRRGRERLERVSAELAPGGEGAERDDPLGSLLRLEQQALVHRALWTVPERQRTCLLLRHAGYSYAEIAETCELAVGSVGVLLARAERTFRDSYQRQQQGADHEVP